MTEYEYVFEMFDQDDTVDVPDEAVGVTVDSFSDSATVRYLLPVEDDDGR